MSTARRDLLPLTANLTAGFASALARYDTETAIAGLTRPPAACTSVSTLATLENAMGQLALSKRMSVVGRMGRSGLVGSAPVL